MACRSYVYLEGEEVVHARKKEGEKIKVKHDERKKIMCKPCTDSLHRVNSRTLLRSPFFFFGRQAIVTSGWQKVIKTPLPEPC